MSDWLTKWRRQSALTQAASVFLLVLSITLLIVNLASPDGAARHLIQVVWAIAMMVWAFALWSDRIAKRGAEQDTL